MAETAAAPFDWDGYFAKQGEQQTAAPVQAGTGGYDWNAHMASLGPTDPDAAPPVAPQMTGWKRPLGLGLETVVGAVDQFLGLPGTLQQAAVSGFNKLTGLQGGKSKLDTSARVLFPSLNLPSGSQLTEATNQLGLTGRPDLVPQGTLEEYGTGALGGAVTGALATATGGGSLLANSAAAVAGNEAGTAAHQTFPGNKWLPGVAGFIAGLGVNSVSNWLSRGQKAAEAVSNLALANQRLTAALDSRHYGGKEAGDLADQVMANSKALLEAKTAAAAGAREAAEQTTNATFETVAGQHSDTATLEDAGSSLQQGARDWLGTVLPSRLKTAWAPVDAAVGPTAQVGLDQFKYHLEQINSQAGELEPLAALLKPRLPKQLQGVLSAVENPEPTDVEKLTALEDEEPKTYNWQDVAKLRTVLGDAMTNPGVLKDVGAQNISRLYAGLSADMKQAAGEAGAEDAFALANQESKALYSTAEGPMAKLVTGATKDPGKEPLPGAVAARVLGTGKRDAGDLAVYRQELPAAVDDLAAAQLRVGGPAAWAKLNPNAKAALVSSPDHVSTLDSALAFREQAGRDADTAVLSAKRDHAELSAATKADKEAGDWTRTDRVYRARQEMEAAKAAVPEPQPPVQNLYAAAKHVSGGVLGFHYAPQILAGLGLGTGLVNELGLGAAGLALPYAWNSLKDAAGNPLPVAAATAAGSNSLALGPAPAKP